jgi:hypothetical protein
MGWNWGIVWLVQGKGGGGGDVGVYGHLVGWP